MLAGKDALILAEARAAWNHATQDLLRIAREFAGEWDGASANAGWTNRQLLAHLATGYVVRLATLHGVLSGEPSAPEIDLEAANAANVARAEALSIDEIVGEMERVRAEVASLLQRLTPDHLEVRTQLAGGAPLRDALPLLSEHDLEHARELRATPSR
ncbi:MAG: DinB family protein [Chloroflexi bacterium]|nr:DinB family protein [Chloroflexota bacterium]